MWTGWPSTLVRLPGCCSAACMSWGSTCGLPKVLSRHLRWLSASEGGGSGGVHLLEQSAGKTSRPCIVQPKEKQLQDRWTCRNCEIASMNVSTSLKPCDFKWGKLLDSLQLFRCIYKFDQRLPLSLEPESETFRNVLREAISAQSEELNNCKKALINGILVDEDVQCTSGGTNQVELLLPFMNRVPSCALKEEEITGLAIFTGVISASAYLGPKETAFEAVSELKGDIINSLHSRLDISCEEASLADASANPTTDLDKGTPADGVDSQDIFSELKSGRVLLFPRRVLLPWLGNVFVCDYLQPSETVEALGNHCGEMMAMDSPISSGSAMEEEKEASPPSITTFRDAALGRSAPLHNGSGLAGAFDEPGPAARPTRESGSSYLPLAAVALLVAILIGWILTAAVH
ncbi:oxidoreductase, zinc-binding dehydrogenase family protein isoform X2 [Wolffia australiana]